MNYSEISDFDLNCAVAGALGREFFSNEKPDDSRRRRKSYEIDGKHRDVCESGWTSELFAPCNSWADAGPIIQKNKIDINWAMQRGNVRQPYARNSAPGLSGHAGYIHENPLRAAMIVFLMMQEATNAA